MGKRKGPGMGVTKYQPAFVAFDIGAFNETVASGCTTSWAKSRH
jgi:hypothetical protein